MSDQHHTVHVTDREVKVDEDTVCHNHMQRLVCDGEFVGFACYGRLVLTVMSTSVENDITL